MTYLGAENSLPAPFSKDDHGFITLLLFFGDFYVKKDYFCFENEFSIY